MIVRRKIEKAPSSNENTQSEKSAEVSAEAQDKKNQERGGKLARIAERTRTEGDGGDRQPTAEELEQRAQESYDAVMQQAQEEYAKNEQKLAEQLQQMEAFNERLREIQNNSPAQRKMNEIASREAKRMLDEVAAKKKREETLQQTGLTEAQLSGVESLKKENERDAELQLFFDSNEKLKLARDLIEGQDEATAKKNRQEHPELAKYFKIIESLTQKRKSNKESSIWMATALSKVPKELIDSIVNGGPNEARSTQEKDEQFAKILENLEQFFDLKEEYERGRAEQRELEQSERDAKKTVRDLEKTTGFTAGFKKRKAQKELDKITEQAKTKRTQNDELWKKSRSLRDEVARINNLLSNEVMSIME